MLLPSNFTVTCNDKQVDLSYIKDATTKLCFRVVEGANYVSSFTLTELPGCCGVCVSHNSVIAFSYRNQGLQHLFNQYRQWVARELRYTVMICTNQQINLAQAKVLEKNNWQKLLSFKNKRTNNMIDLQVVVL